jgi:hypothetical protein
MVIKSLSSLTGGGASLMGLRNPALWLLTGTAQVPNNDSANAKPAPAGNAGGIILTFING